MGVSLIIEEIIKQKKLLVGHNMMFDIMFIY